MGGHGHGEPYKVPHPSIYKIDNIPQLQEVQESLARQGLRDPWIRNEAWRYDASRFGTHASRARVFFLRGLLWGTLLTAATVGLEYALGSNDAHGHHGHGHDHDDKKDH